MKRGILGVAIWVLLMASPAIAAQKPKGGPKPQPVTKASKSTVQTKSSVKPQAGPKSKTTLKANTKIKTAPAGSTKASKPAKTTKTAKTTTSTSTSTTTTGGTQPTTTSVTLSPVQQKLQKNTNLAAKMQSRLPDGTDLMTAAAGFKSLGQFVSTVNASYNHDLEFPALKRRIVNEGMSLGQAMQAMKDLK